MIGDAALDPVGFVADELAARGALVDRGDVGTLAVLPSDLASQLGLPAELVFAAAPGDSVIGCGLGSPLLDVLVNEVRTRVPVASLAWLAEAPRAAVAERLAGRLVVRNGVADVLGVTPASTTYLAHVFVWTAEADDRYQGVAMIAANARTAGEPDATTTSAIEALLAGHDPRFTEAQGAGDAIRGVAAIAARAALAIGSRLDEVGTAVARRRDRERARIDEYFTSLVAEAKRPRRQVARDAIDARVAALHAEHVAKVRDLAARYAMRIRIEPVALAAITTRVAEIRLRLRRRKGERELVLHLPPGARAPDALACAACPATTLAPLLCDDALHVLCESCGPEVTGRPRCPACRAGRS